MIPLVSVRLKLACYYQLLTTFLGISILHSLLKIISASLIVILSVSTVYAKTIHKERSIYRNVVITEHNNQRCMRFETRRRAISNQACIDLKNKQRLVFEYTQSIMAGLAFNQSPKRILIIGLGGGSLPNAFAQLLPKTEVVSVEIDPAVAKLAKSYFDYQESDKIKTEIIDGRVYVKRALKKKQQFDWIILDAFNGDYIPEHLLTVEFLTEVKNLLSAEGLLSANTFNGSKLYDYESVTYQRVFDQIRILKSPSKGNRIIFACNCKAIDQQFKMDDNLAKQLAPYGVNLYKAISRINAKVDWNESVEPLTDQFSPANLLNQ
jgi:spermidine synthase